MAEGAVKEPFGLNMSLDAMIEKSGTRERPGRGRDRPGVANGGDRSVEASPGGRGLRVAVPVDLKVRGHSRRGGRGWRGGFGGPATNGFHHRPPFGERQVTIGFPPPHSPPFFPGHPAPVFAVPPPGAYPLPMGMLNHIQMGGGFPGPSPPPPVGAPRYAPGSAGTPGYAPGGAGPPVGQGQLGGSGMTNGAVPVLSGELYGMSWNGEHDVGQSLAARSAPGGGALSARLNVQQTCEVNEATGDVVVRFKNTDILKVAPNGNVTLDTGGFMGPATFESLNTALQSIGIKVTARGPNDWSVSDGRTLARFQDGMVLPGRGNQTQHRAQTVLSYYRGLDAASRLGGKSGVSLADAATAASTAAAAAAGLLPAATMTAAGGPQAGAAGGGWSGGGAPRQQPSGPPGFAGGRGAPSGTSPQTPFGAGQGRFRPQQGQGPEHRPRFGGPSQFGGQQQLGGQQNGGPPGSGGLDPNEVRRLKAQGRYG